MNQRAEVATHPICPYPKGINIGTVDQAEGVVHARSTVPRSTLRKLYQLIIMSRDRKSYLCDTLMKKIRT